ncbi:MAG: sensor domain-containing diguanylate cyclase, partial [Saprospiraceae bacterium]|nr:sensor domain-containing diguanylate cyclase [Pyrinomonadaceae bacterium]
LVKTAERLEKFSRKRGEDILEIDKPAVKMPEILDERSNLEPAAEITNLIKKFNEGTDKPASPPGISAGAQPQDDSKEISAWRSLFGSLMKLEYRQACSSILDFLSTRYGLSSLIWLERRENNLECLISLGRLTGKAVKVGIAADSERLRAAALSDTPLELRERKRDEANTGRQTLSLFPVTIGGEIRGAIGVEGDSMDDTTKRNISRFAQTVASQLEILRLRDEVSERDWLSRAVMRFNESLKNIDTEDFWLHVTQISAELLGAERASILIQNEKSNSLRAKAAIGTHIDLVRRERVGDRVASVVLDGGNPVIVSNIERVGMESSPVNWSYKTASFIIYPILIGSRKMGVLNFTDKAGGDEFTQRDLELLRAIAPQIAVAIDRTTLKDKAGEYEQLSVTDTLTGLLNRRYIEERLTEEITRSRRHRFPMSLMMLDVDNFKSYNDSYGHPAGDIALKIVADVLKETLRGADVAARYGGEEFAILLPQTSSEEAAPIAERIRQRIERTEFPKRRVTVSIGIASCSEVIDSPKNLVSAADVALYEAKNHGRNNVQIFGNLGNSLIENIH